MNRTVWFDLRGFSLPYSAERRIFYLQITGLTILGAGCFLYLKGRREHHGYHNSENRRSEKLKSRKEEYYLKEGANERNNVIAVTDPGGISPKSKVG